MTARTTARTTTRTAASGARGVWETTITGWHYAMWGTVALGTITVLTRNGLGAADRLGVGVVLTVLLIAYELDVRRRDPGESRSAIVYLMLAILGVGIACAIDPMFTLLLFIVFPQAWLFTGDRRRGALATLALTVSATLGLLTATGFTRSNVVDIAPQMVISMAFSVMLGWWIYRIIEQSHERAGLITELDRTRSELAEVHRQAGVAAERERMAREIHDTLAQGFTSVLMLAQAAAARPEPIPPTVRERLAGIEEVARQNLAEARALVAAFTPADLDGAELREAVRRVLDRFARSGTVSVTAEIADHLGELDRAAEVVLLRAAQEALSNIARHAAARHVTVRLAGDGDAARLDVVDDGTGFDPAGPASGAGGVGLGLMRRRVSEVGGVLTVTSAPGAGTRVEVRIPARRTAAEEVR